MAHNKRSKKEKGRHEENHSTYPSYAPQEDYPGYQNWSVEEAAPVSSGLEGDFASLQVSDTPTYTPYYATNPSADAGYDNSQTPHHYPSNFEYQPDEHQPVDETSYPTQYPAAAFPEDEPFPQSSPLSFSPITLVAVATPIDPYAWTNASNAKKERIKRETRTPYDGPGRPDFVATPSTRVEYYDPYRPANGQELDADDHRARDAEIAEKIRLEQTEYAAKTYQPLNNQKRYTGVRVCMVRWDKEEKGDLRVTPEMEKLETAFRLWGFVVERLFIPLSDSEKYLRRGLRGFLKGCGGSDLAIVLYKGHGAQDPQGGLTLVWQSKDKKKPTFAETAWEPMRQQLEKASQDVLVILDCCCAASAWSAIKEGESSLPTHKRMAIMAACAADLSSWNYDWSISWCLAEVLTSWAGLNQTHAVSSLVLELQDVAKEHVYRQVRAEPDGYATNRHIALPYGFDVSSGGAYEDEIHLYDLTL